MFTGISCTFRPLTIFELQHATQTQILDPGDEDIGEDDLPSPDLILAVCAGLLIRDENGIVHLVHPSTQEYFDRRRTTIFPVAHHEITIACIRCLSLKAISTKLATVFLTSITMSVDQVYHAYTWTIDLRQRYPLLFYASTEWRRHARKHIEETCNSNIQEDYWGSLLKQLNHAGIMSYAATSGQNCISIMLLVKEENDTEEGLERSWTALSWSSHNAHLRTTQCVISKEFLTGKRKHDMPLIEDSNCSLELSSLAGDSKRLLIPLATSIEDTLMLNPSFKSNAEGEWCLVPSLLNGTAAIHAPLIRDLLSYGAELKVRNEEEATNLWQAAADGGRIEIAEILLSSGFQPNSPDLRGHTPLFRAAICGHSEMIEMLVSNGADINALDRSSRTALFQASLFGHVSVVEVLIAHGAKVDARDREGCTALCFISKAEVKHPNLEVVKSLLANGIDINARDDSGNSALEYAALAEETGLVEALVAHGAHFKSMAISEGPTVLACAVTRGKIRLAECLMAKEVQEEVRPFGCSAALLGAVIKGDRSLVECLLMDTEPNPTYLEFALILRHESIIECILLRHTLDINAVSINGAGILAWAVMLGELSMVETILKNGAAVNSKSVDGLTPLMLATVTGQRSIVKVLLAHGADVHDDNCEAPLDCILGTIDLDLNRESVVSKWSNEAYKMKRFVS